MDKKSITILIFLFLIYAIIMYNLYSDDPQGIPSFGNFSIYKNSEESMDIPVYVKYISTNYKGCSGLGNQMFRLAVHYGIGREIHRTPFFHANRACQIQAMKEIKNIFPNYYNFAKLFNATKNESIEINEIPNCCNYENITDLNQKFLIFKHNMPQYFGYFEKYTDHIKYLMEFDEKLKQNISNFADSLFRDDKSHKFCIHIRRGDFLSKFYGYQESRSSFIVPATIYIYNYLKKQGTTNISLLLLGQDEKFKHGLKINSSIFHNIYFPSFSSRGHDMAFGAMNCDTYLISAAISTFAWWTAYLLPEGNNIFYNANVLKKGVYHDYDKVFLPHWKKLDLN